MGEIRIVPLIAIAAIVLTLFSLAAYASTLNPTYDRAVGPNDYDTVPIPGSSGFDVDVRITSDIPVDMYVMTMEQLTAYQSNNKTLMGYEEAYLDQTSKSFTYTGSGSGSDWVLIINDDPSSTANVHVEFKVLQEVGKEASKACCGSTILAGFVFLFGAIAILSVMRRV